MKEKKKPGCLNTPKIRLQYHPVFKKHLFFYRFCAFLISFLACLIPHSTKAEKKKLVIYSYHSLTSSWGSGPKIEKIFESICHCDLIFISVADGILLLNRIRLEKERTQADIVLGLDMNLIAEAKETGLFVKSNMAKNLHLPIVWTDDVFVPFDYGYFALVYNKEKQKNPPASLKELVEKEDPDMKIILQDPRTSTPGLGFLLWMKKIYGDDAGKAWQKLKKKILTITPGWSESYGLFLKEEAAMTISYTTSPAWHMIEQKTEKYAAAPFQEGHYIQIEVAGITKKGAKNPLAEQFINFMTGSDFQNIIPETNWMFPAGKTSLPLNTAFENMVHPKITLLFTPEEILKNRKRWIEEWLSAMSQ